MGCVGSSADGEAKRKTEDVDYKNIADDNPDYPPPYIPDSCRDEVIDKDVNSRIQTRIDTMPKQMDQTYESLLKYLSEGATKEAHHVTAIFLWMRCQDYHDDALDLEKDGDTPRGYMKLIKAGEGDFTTFFTILCRRSGIPCKILHGLGKGKDYYIGKPERQMTTCWCAVFADEEWRLVHVQWAMAGATDDNQNVQNGQANADFFFFTDPDEFATICHPENFRWQLLNQAYSKEEFIKLPYFTPAFFQMDASILGLKAGSVTTHNGKMDFEIAFPRKQMDNIQIKCLLTYQQPLKDMDKKSEAPKTLEKFVFVNRKPSMFICELVFPVPGRYLFDIYNVDANKNGAKIKDMLCQFRIQSDRKFTEETLPEPLPEVPPIGWGPGPTCRKLGLVPLTHFEGCIYMKPGETRDIHFRLTRDLDVVPELTHSYLPIYQLVEQVESEITEDELRLSVQIPEDGHYALKVFAREAGTKDYHLACVYLLRQREKPRLPENYERGHRRKHRDKMLRARLERHLETHTSRKELQAALDALDLYNVPDKGERKRADVKIKQYWEVKTELNSAIKGRNGNVLRKWLERARASPYTADLQDDIKRAEAVDGSLGRRKGYMHPIARMDPHTMTEIHNYRRPPRVAHDVMMATYLLLGERKDDLEEWEQIQYLMNQPGADSLKRRILARRPEDVYVHVAEQADDVIKPYSMEKTREVSNGVSAFYKWNKQFIRDVQQRDMNERERNQLSRDLSGRETYRETNTAATSDATTTRPSNVFVGRGPPLQEEDSGTPREDSSEKMHNENSDRRDSSAQQKTRSNGQRKSEEQGNPVHPFAPEEKQNGHGAMLLRKFFASPSKPTEREAVTPVAYAGWKPQN
ncbi:lim and transglutaminase domain protein ltd-1-like isoform X1 [Mya arenaria]|uniref:lim and transglutaminase domain protein ltd-1-like isoform X1 n=1 Tax=Mya arenaria TaxID=6604 RepID=UPI0022E20414|nr:lim and transglutaminase domain protein ltd-1-like isoform X1 [Mya arenaria]XP_052796218.1 lim and transglutaminase domain protein ltd-1-like isoform X1 [Mya arenaria]